MMINVIVTVGLKNLYKTVFVLKSSYMTDEFGKIFITALYF